MFTQTLLTWFEENRRDLPWRGIDDPYKIWVSEIILQQTRVVQGISYYHHFLQKFPTVSALAAADETSVLKVWQGLGYYSRARNMHAAAKSIVENLNGVFPNNYQEIRKLKGVGDYTAAAVASIAFGLPYPAVDGNVLRFVTRFKGIFDDISLNTTKKTIEQICSEWIPANAAGTFNQAMMEMGATQCVPTNPDCTVCPFAPSCHAHIHDQVHLLPVKEKKVKIRDRFFQYLIYLKDNQTVIQKRTEDDIWKGLYEFPLEETPTSQFDILHFLKENRIVFEGEPQLVLQKKHILSHQRIFANFFIINILDLKNLKEGQELVAIESLPSFAVSKITEMVISKMCK